MVHHANLQGMSPSTSSASEVIKKGTAYLNRNSPHWEAETDTGLRYKDNFAELLILEATGNWRLVDLKIPPKKWNYFGGKAVITPDPYPDDIDTQSLANTIIKPIDKTAHALLDEILSCENEDGIIPVYYEPSRPRVSVEVCTNVCTFFYTYGRGAEVQKSFDFVYSTLKNRDFSVKRYYATPEPLFFYVYRLVHSGKSLELDRMKDELKECVIERIGTEVDNAVYLAIRVLICQKLGIPNPMDLENLIGLQEDNGSFGIGWYYNFGNSKIKIGHRALTAALSVEAIRGAVDQNHLRDPITHPAYYGIRHK